MITRKATIAAAACLALTAAAFATMPATAVAAADPVPDPTICIKSDGYYQHRVDPQYFYVCDGAYRPRLDKCPGGLWFNEDPGVLVCDEPEYVRAHGTGGSVTAQQARLQKLPLKVTGLSATLSPGIAGEKVTFTSFGNVPLCTATAVAISRDKATATCNSQGALGDLGATLDGLLRGYKVTVKDDPRTATGSIRLL
ncbi:chitin binding peritrophin-A domain-containing protein [Kitasatospora sp. NPDC052868]|uniref:chitin binding peritrophin-A domain-containing protein n=1 Tax=Kitasatospora sp. NPDC052868 TaxID=3364060 RepID=UPI0037C94F5F